jgi:hypothetical protein
MGRSGRYLLNVGGGNEFALGDFDGERNVLSNLSATYSTDIGAFSADWTAVGAANGRILQVGWLSNYRLGPHAAAPRQLQALGLIRELFYEEESAPPLRVLPPLELALLHNGSLLRALGGVVR